ncbi:hypothetical protein ALMA_1385 [Alloscardovia macacae]|uniref:Uncharacterized protein n=1 Tax=Alloscardovia macacae TaxID=1160091 RepID=A0A261F1Y7_9BIFI|nr:hypothetical protein ALMA_1385 [Alloscardovia macacae]
MHKSKKPPRFARIRRQMAFWWHYTQFILHLISLGEFVYAEICAEEKYGKLLSKEELDER